MAETVRLSCKFLGDALVKGGVISACQRDLALRSTAMWGGTFRQNLVRLGYTTEELIVSYMEKTFDVPRIDLKTAQVDPEAVSMVQRKLAENFCGILIAYGEGQVRFVMSDPTDIFGLGSLTFISGCDIDLFVAPEPDILEAIRTHYPPLHRG